MMNGNFRIARVGLHHFEEPCISGNCGSGTVFFSGCNLKCVFCQNYEISHGNKGLDVSPAQFLSAVDYLVDSGAENLNLVTPTIYAARLVPVLRTVKERYSDLPVVWNSSGYESVKSIKNLDGLVDIYLPDFKYSDNRIAEEYSNAVDYGKIASAAISEMRRQRPYDVFDGEKMISGVIVRHLVLPDALENTRGVLNSIAKIDPTMYVSLMSQYFPTPAVENRKSLGRRITAAEYDRAVEYFFDAGLKNGFSQEPESATEEYVPSFDLDDLKKIIN